MNDIPDNKTSNIVNCSCDNIEKVDRNLYL